MLQESRGSKGEKKKTKTSRGGNIGFEPYRLGRLLKDGRSQSIILGREQRYKEKMEQHKAYLENSQFGWSLIHSKDKVRTGPR